MATFTNITGADDLDVKDEFGRNFRFSRGEARVDSDFLFKYTVAGGSDNPVLVADAAVPDPLITSALFLENVIASISGDPAERIKSIVVDTHSEVGNRRVDSRHLGIREVSGAPDSADAPGLYSDGSDVWVVFDDTVIIVSNP